MTDKPDCYKCIHRGGVASSAHSSCKHPQAGGGDAVGNLFATFASVGRGGPVVDIGGAEALNIHANPHGVRQGWFNWPYNFDPMWLQQCDGFEARNEQPAQPQRIGEHNEF